MTEADKFHNELESTVTDLKDLKIGCSRFRNMLAEHQGVQTAKILLKGKNISEGLKDLFLVGRTDLSVEQKVINFESSGLFTPDEIKEAKRRLGK